MNRPRPILTTYEIEQIANIYNRIKRATAKEISDTEGYMRDCWPGKNPDWIVGFFRKLVEHASKED